MAEPLVDVVLATNRVSAYLTEAIAGVASQTYSRWRLIVVGDGCPDPEHLRTALEHLPNSELVLLDHAGVSAARNAGFRAGSGALVAILDDDDVWAPDKLAAQVAALDASPTSAGCFTAGWYLDGEGHRFGHGWSAEPTRRTEFLSGAVPAPRIVSLVVRRAAWDAIGGFDTSYSMAEDNDFVLRLLQHGELACVSDALVGYRRHASNTSAAGGLRERAANRRLLLEQVEAARRRGDHSTAEALRQKVCVHRREWADETVRGIADAWRHGDVSAAARQLAWALRVTPGGTVRSALKKLHSRSSGA